MPKTRFIILCLTYSLAHQSMNGLTSLYMTNLPFHKLLRKSSPYSKRLPNRFFPVRRSILKNFLSPHKQRTFSDIDDVAWFRQFFHSPRQPERLSLLSLTSLSCTTSLMKIPMCPFLVLCSKNLLTKRFLPITLLSLSSRCSC